MIQKVEDYSLNIGTEPPQMQSSIFNDRIYNIPGFKMLRKFVSSSVLALTI